MSISEIKSPVSSSHATSKLASKLSLSPGARSNPSSCSDASPQTFSPSPPTPAHDAEEPEQGVKGTDTEGEQEMKALPPLEEEPNVAADSVRQMTCADPKHLRQFEQLFGQSIFDNASVGVTGPDE